MCCVIYNKMGIGWINKVDVWKYVRVNMVFVDFYIYSDGFILVSWYEVCMYEGCFKNNM